MVLSPASSFSIKKLRPSDRPHHLSSIYFEFGPHRRQSKDSLSIPTSSTLSNTKRNLDVELNSIKEEETLKYQGQIEKEAKQKQFAGQSRNSTQTHMDKVVEKLQDVNLEPCANDQDMHEPLKPYVQVVDGYEVSKEEVVLQQRQIDGVLLLVIGIVSEPHFSNFRKLMMSMIFMGIARLRLYCNVIDHVGDEVNMQFLIGYSL
ncbi:hypothetical protein ACLB2K_021984 [Fragaria x ananassa]